VRRLEASGVAVHLATADVGDDDQLRAVVERYAAEGWPPIRGVVHAAGVVENRLATSMDRASFEAALRPKLRAAQLLDRLFPDAEPFVLFSSVASLLPVGGDANYAAANAGLDALAADRCARGLRATSIAWAAWDGCGLAGGEAGAGVARELARQGIGGLPPERGRALFAELCGSREPLLAVLPIAWPELRRARAGRGEPLYRDLAAAAAPGDGPDLRRQLAAAPAGERRRLVESAVRDAVARVLKLAPARVEARKPLGALGLGSLLAMELRNRLEAALGRSLPATLAWNYPTVEALVDHLAGADAAAPPPLAAGARDAARDALPAGVGELALLSDEEAALALRGATPGGAR
jgi:myxalamid-type polyketide synthase MxaE and MxaD